jgi:hypothetical protein
MDAEKNKKLQQYATILTDQAKEAEQAGKSDEAIKHYLKLVDVFLVLASEASDHTTWMQFIRQAEAYQTRIRSLVPKDQPTQDIGARIPPPPSERGLPSVNVRRPEPVVSTNMGNPQGIPPPTTVRTSPISKILKPFQGGREIGNPLEEYSSNNLQTPNLRQQVPPQTPAVTPVNSPQLVSQKPVAAPVEERPPVPHEVYDRALSENKVLHERLQTVMKETDEKIAFLESRSRELEDRIAMMVPKMDYDQLRLEFENMVPKHEYDRLKTELTNTVPISHYDQLLDRIANMVPREIYMNSERRILELEDNLRRSVPLAVIDDIANEVSYVSILAEVPPIVNDTSKKEGKEEDAEDLVKEESAESSSSMS